jgi:hypothetical protein
MGSRRSDYPESYKQPRMTLKNFVFFVYSLARPLFFSLK